MRDESFMVNRRARPDCWVQPSARGPRLMRGSRRDGASSMREPRVERGSRADERSGWANEHVSHREPTWDEQMFDACPPGLDELITNMAERPFGLVARRRTAT